MVRRRTETADTTLAKKTTETASPAAAAAKPGRSEEPRLVRSDLQGDLRHDLARAVLLGWARGKRGGPLQASQAMHEEIQTVLGGGWTVIVSAGDTYLRARTLRGTHAVFEVKAPASWSKEVPAVDGKSDATPVENAMITVFHDFLDSDLSKAGLTTFAKFELPPANEAVRVTIDPVRTAGSTPEIVEALSQILRRGFQTGWRAATQEAALNTIKGELTAQFGSTWQLALGPPRKFFGVTVDPFEDTFLELDVRVAQPEGKTELRFCLCAWRSKLPDEKAMDASEDGRGLLTRLRNPSGWLRFFVYLFYTLGGLLATTGALHWWMCVDGVHAGGAAAAEAAPTDAASITEFDALDHPELAEAAASAATAATAATDDALAALTNSTRTCHDTTRLLMFGAVGMLAVAAVLRRLRQNLVR